MTRTYATLTVSRQTIEDIIARLRAVGSAGHYVTEHEGSPAVMLGDVLLIAED